MADTEQKTAPTPYVPKSQVDPEVLMKAFQDEGIVPADTEPADRQENSQQPSEPPKSEEPALLRIAREKAAKRQAEQASRPQSEALAVFSPQELERAAQARRSGDPVAVLNALGFSHEQYTKALLGMKDEPKEQKEQPQASPDVAALKAEVERLRAEREQEKLQSTRAQTLGQVKEILKGDPKFTYTAALEAAEGVEAILVEFYNAHGSLPGENFNESVKLAAEVFEVRLRSGEIPLTKKQWEKIQGLTQPASSAVVASKAPESQPSAGTDTHRTLTNSNTSAPAAVKSVPKTRAEILQAFMEGRESELG